MEIARATLGILFFCAVSWLISENKRRISLRVVIGGILAQVLLAVVILQTTPGATALRAVSTAAKDFLAFGEKGAEMVFGPLTGFAHVPPQEDGEPPKPVTWFARYPFQLKPAPKDDAATEVKADATGSSSEKAASTPEPSASEPSASEPSASEPSASEPSASEPSATGSPAPVAGGVNDDSPDPTRNVKIVFGLKALPTIIYFSAVMAILYYLGIVQVVISALSRLMMRVLGVSGAESLAMAANIFAGQTEAPLVVRPYIPSMTRSELMALMTGGFATIAGSMLAVYVGLLGDEYAGHLLAASFMSAPAAFVIAKIMIPETETPKTSGDVRAEIEKNGDNVIDAAANGTADGLKLFLNVIAMLIAFVAIVAVINWPLSMITVADAPLSLERIFGWVFSPVAWMMGVAWADCQSFGTLLGQKIVVNEFIAYDSLTTMKSTHAMSQRSLTMAAYALCGFANFSSIGIQLGGIGPLAPKRRKDLSRIAVRAMFGGAFASWMTATIAGAFI